MGRCRTTFALAVVLCFVGIVPLAGTAVLYWSTPQDDVIFIAADSTVLDRDGKPTGAQVCKIAPGPRFAMALSGMVRFRLMSRDSRTGAVTPGARVDLFDIAREVVKEAKTVDDAAKAFDLKARDALDVLASDTRTGTLLDLLVAGFQNGQPATLTVHYAPIKDAAGRTVARGTVAVACPPNCARLGTPRGFGQIDNGLQVDWLRLKPDVIRDPIAMADALLTQQIARRTAEGHPGFIAKPVDVLEITANGMRWKQWKKECPEI